MKFLSDILAKAGLTVDGVVTLNNTATGQTPAANDNSTKLATTAWVRGFVTPYSLPIASGLTLGGIKIGSGLAIDGTGIVSVAATGVGAIRALQQFTATAGQTVFTVSGGYTPGLIDVFLNGVLLTPTSITASNGTTFTLSDAALVNDVLDVFVYNPIYGGFISSTDQVPEGATNLYFTNARVRTAISLTTTGVSGVATYNSSTGVFNIPNYQGLVPSGGTTGQILTKNSSTDYDSAWIENYADWTAVLKHRVKASEAITKGQAVYVSSADGTNMIVSKASNATEGTSSKTMGLLESTVSTNGIANVITEGLLTGLNTATATAGDPVWLGTGGNLIYGLLNKPVAPAHLVFIGIVTRVNANNGEIFVKVQNGFELDELHDLSVKNASDGDMIKYVASTGLWTKIAATTTNITEGTNLYYTDARSRAAISVTGSGSYNSSTGVITVTGGVTSVNTLTGAVTLTTTNIAEGTNLYYTDARVGSYLTTNSYATQTYVGTQIANLVASAPATLDTLNELAAALGNDPSFATTVATSIGTKVPQTRTITINGTGYDLSADRSWTIASGVTSFNTRTGAITSANGDYTTAQVTESGNLYYTDTRVRAAISLTTTGTSGAATYDSATGIFNIPQYQGGVTSFNTRTGAISLTSSDVTTALTYTPVTNARTLTINGTAYDLTADRTWTVGVSPSARTIQTYTATAAQTTFTVTGGYVVGLIDVFINGVRLTSADFTATNGTTVVLTTGTSLNNVVDIIKYTSAFTASSALRQVSYFTATAGQTTFTVSYTPGLIDVFYNGSKLAASEYTASNGTTVVLANAAVLNDALEIISYAYSVGAFSGLSTTRTLTINGTSYDLSADRTWTITNATLGAQPQLNGTGLVRMSGTTVSYDNATYATQSYVTTAVANLVDAAPSTLDTLNELAAALGDDPNFATTIATSIGTKQPQLNGTGFVKISGTTISYDNSTYLTTTSASSTYLPLAGGTLTGVLTSTSTAPLSFQSNSNTGTYNPTIIYFNQNNTSANTANGVFIERGRLTDSASAEVRYFVIGARGGTIQWQVDGSGNTTQTGSITNAGEYYASVNNTYLRGRNSGNTAYIATIGVNGSNKVAIDPDGYGTVFGAGVTATSFGGGVYPYNSILGVGADASTGTIFAGSTAGYASSIDVAGGGATNPNTIIFKTASTTRFTITSTGAAIFNGPTVTIGTAVAATNVKLLLNGVASKAAGIEFQQNGTAQWYIGNGIASEDNNFELYNSNGTMAMKIIKSTNAINFIGTLTATGTVRSINGGVDASYQDAFVGVYSSNNNEQNAIQTSVSSVAASSGFRFQVSNGGGSSSRTTMMTLTRSNLSVSNEIIIGAQGGTDTTYISGGSGYGSVIRNIYAGGSVNNELRGNGNNYFNVLLGSMGVGTSNPQYTLDVNGSGRFVGALYANNTIYGTRIIGGNLIAGNMASNMPTSPSYILILDINDIAGFSMSGKVNAASYTCWNISDIWIEKDYSSTTVRAGIEGKYKSGCDFSIVDISYGAGRYIAFRFTSNPEVDVLLTGYRLTNQVSGGSFQVITSGVTVNGTYASY
jgi:hypothetical protein